MTIDDTKAALRFLFAAYPSQRMRMRPEDIEAMLLAYSTGFADLELAHVTAAISRLARTERWLPTIADIRAAIGVVVHGTETSGSEAWGAVLKAIREMGQLAKPGEDFTWRDPITARVVSALGWFDLCASTSSAADRKNFVDAYNQISATERTEAQASTGATSKMLPRREPIPVIERAAEAQSLGAIVGDMLKGPTS